MFAFMLGALVATATPSVPSPAPAAVVAKPSSNIPAPPDLGVMLKMFDTMFPPQPAPDPARLVMAHTTALALLPADSFGRSVVEAMGGLFERVLEIRGSDLPGASKAASKSTLHQELAAKDPYFEERMRLTRAAVTTELLRASAIMEPRLRDGVARAVARRFDQRQLTDINAFLATDSGKAFGKQFLGLWFDPDLMRSTIAAMPELVELMPGAMERITASTAHLPKPPKPVPPKPPKKIVPKAR